MIIQLINYIHNNYTQFCIAQYTLNQKYETDKALIWYLFIHTVEHKNAEIYSDNNFWQILTNFDDLCNALTRNECSTYSEYHLTLDVHAHYLVKVGNK